MRALAYAATSEITSYRQDPSRAGFDRRTTAVRLHSFREDNALEIEKIKIVDWLRDRGQDARADWVDRELPNLVDTVSNAGLLATLGLNPADLAGPSSP